MLPHYLLGGQEGFRPSQMQKVLENQIKNKILTWTPRCLYFDGLHVGFFCIGLFLEYFFLWPFLFARTNLYFDFHRDKIHTSVQVMHKQNI